MVDTNNAHIRPSATRESPDMCAEEARRLLDDPAFRRGFDGVERGLFDALRNFAPDGSPESDAYEREVCRAIRTLHNLKRAISIAVQGNTLRKADFRPRTEITD